MRTITFDELRSLAIGTGILGTGGGTHPYLELLNIEKLYRDGATVDLVDPADLGDDAFVAEIGFMGAPLITKERLPDPAHVLRPLRLMESHASIRFSAVMAGEIGAENGVLSFLAAALTGLPVVDADTMGRAFPEMQMSSFVIQGLPLVPFALSDIRDTDVIQTLAAGPIWVERIGRKICTEMGSIATTCRPPRRGRDVKAYAVHNTVSRAIRLGEAVRRARELHLDPVDSILSVERGILVFRGKVLDVQRRTSEGFVRGRATIDGLDDFRGQTFIVDFQNEFTVGYIDGKPVVMVPDLICILDLLSCEAIGTETIRYGQRVAVVSLPAAPILISDAGLKYVGPRAFGYPFEFKSLHHRVVQ